MRRILAIWLVATLLATPNLPGQTDDEPVTEGGGAAPQAAETSPPAPPPADAAKSPPTSPPTSPPAEAAPEVNELAPDLPPPAADGTTSVIVPPPAVPPVGDRSGPPAAPPPPVPLAATPAATGPPAGSIAPPPPASLAPPPPSEAAALLASLLEPLAGPTGGPPVAARIDPLLYSRPLPLLEPLARSGDRSRRLWIVQAYWKAATGFALVRSASEAVERLELVAPGGDPFDRATLDVATAAARADLADATARLAAAQQELVDLARLPVGEPLPWPIDRPLADPYQTHFEAIFANRIATGRVRGIVRSLPARHEAVASRAAAVTAAATARDMAEADHARGKRPIEAVLAAHDAFVAQQAAFLEAVRTYNLEIAEYAMAVADLALPDEAFVTMLIGTPAPWPPQPIQAVSAASFAPAPGTAPPPPAVALPPALVSPPGFVAPVE